MDSFTEVYDAVRALREQRDFAGALALLDGREKEFDLHAGLIYLTRAGVLADSGRADDALDALEKALAAGCRYKRSWLESDRALARLRSLARFAEIVDRSDRRYEQEAAEAHPMLTTVVPSSDQRADHEPLLVVLHGNNSNMHSELHFWSTASERGWLIAVPQSGEIGVTPRAYTWNDRERTASELETHIAQLRRENLVHTDRLVLGGFSMGGLQAIALGLTGRIAATGIIAVAPWLPHIKEFTQLARAGAIHRVPTYLVVGDRDPSYSGAKQLVDLLITQGIPAQLETRYGMGHAYPKDVGAWLGPALEFVTR
jgi:dienelactone hydrolase